MHVHKSTPHLMVTVFSFSDGNPKEKFLCKDRSTASRDFNATDAGRIQGETEHGSTKDKGTINRL